MSKAGAGDDGKGFEISLKLVRKEAMAIFRDFVRETTYLAWCHPCGCEIRSFGLAKSADDGGDNDGGARAEKEKEKEKEGQGVEKTRRRKSAIDVILRTNYHDGHTGLAGEDLETSNPLAAKKHGLRMSKTATQPSSTSSSLLPSSYSSHFLSAS